LVRATRFATAMPMPLTKIVLPPSATMVPAPTATAVKKGFRPTMTGWPMNFKAFSRRFRPEHTGVFFFPLVLLLVRLLVRYGPRVGRIDAEDFDAAKIRWWSARRIPSL